MCGDISRILGNTLLDFRSYIPQTDRLKVNSINLMEVSPLDTEGIQTFDTVSQCYHMQMIWPAKMLGHIHSYPGAHVSQEKTVQ